MASRAVSTTARPATRAVAHRMALPAAVASWWPHGHDVPGSAGLALLQDVLAPSSIPYAQMVERRAVLTPELVRALHAAVAAIGEELAQPATTTALVTWMSPLNIASGNPVDAAELARRAASILEVIPNLPAAVLVPETRSLLRSHFTPDLEGVRAMAELALIPRRRMVAKLRMLIAIAPPPGSVATKAEPMLQGEALLRHARKLVANERAGAMGLGSMQAQARVLILHAERHDPAHAVAVAGILAPLLARALPARGRNTEGPVDLHTPLRTAPREPLPAMDQLLSAESRLALQALPVPGLVSGGGGGGARREGRA